MACDGPAKCCTGFMWNDDSKSCEQCSPGYVGINCSDPCLYPNYGIECQMLCTCSQPACNPSFGCDDTSPKIGNTVGISDISKTTKQTTDRVIDLNGSLKTNESFSISRELFAGILASALTIIIGISLLLIFLFIRKLLLLITNRDQNAVNEENHFYEEVALERQNASYQGLHLPTPSICIPIQDGQIHLTKCNSHCKIEINIKTDLLDKALQNNPAETYLDFNNIIENKYRNSTLLSKRHSI